MALLVLVMFGGSQSYQFEILLAAMAVVRPGSF